MTPRAIRVYGLNTTSCSAMGMNGRSRNRSLSHGRWQVCKATADQDTRGKRLRRRANEDVAPRALSGSGGALLGYLECHRLRPPRSTSGEVHVNEPRNACPWFFSVASSGQVRRISTEQLITLLSPCFRAWRITIALIFPIRQSSCAELRFPAGPPRGRRRVRFATGRANRRRRV